MPTLQSKSLQCFQIFHNILNIERKLRSYRSMDKSEKSC